jgi:hypothetical protein
VEKPTRYSSATLWGFVRENFAGRHPVNQKSLQLDYLGTFARITAKLSVTVAYLPQIRSIVGG